MRYTHLRAEDLVGGWVRDRSAVLRNSEILDILKTQLRVIPPNKFKKMMVIGFSYPRSRFSSIGLKYAASFSKE